MSYTVTVQRDTSVLEPSTQPEPFRVVLTVTAVTDFIDPGIFVFQIDTVTMAQIYSHVAVPTDLQNYYFVEVGGEWFVRQPTVTRDFATAELADDFITTTESAIHDLCEQMDILAVIIPGSSTVIDGTTSFL